MASSSEVADGGDAADAEIAVGETADGEPYRLPIEDVLTGRAFITGKSGAGKSNTGSVIAEELLDRGHPLLIVDVDGEYWGLKEEFEILHVGATDECDLQVGPEHAPKLAELALDQHVPIILDVSGYIKRDEADTLVRETARELFAREQELLRPFLILVEEIHEYIPQSGGLDETGEMLVRVAKRGRKRGLGIAGLSQRPANVQKDFITQADLLVWHRLTWQNDTQVVSSVVGGDYADRIGDLGDGQAFVQADWSEADVETVQFRRKRTFDAGATPGLEDVERPELKSIGEDIAEELEDISEQHDRRQDRIAQLEAELERRDERVEELEQELEEARDLQRLGEAFVDAMEGDSGQVAEVDRELLEEKNETIADLRDQVESMEQELDELAAERDDLADEVERLRGIEERVEKAEAIEQQLDRARDALGVEVEARREAEADARVGQLQEELSESRERIADLESENERLRRESGSSESHASDLASMVRHEAVQRAVTFAKEDTDRAGEHFDRVLDILASSDGGPLSAGDIDPLMDGVGETTVQRVLRALYDTGVLRRQKDGRGHKYSLDRDFLERRIEVAEMDGGGRDVE